MKFAIPLLICLTVIFTACTDRDDELETVQIRIKNESLLVFDEVQVGTAETLHTGVEPGAYSDYLEYEEAYRYAYIRIESGEETFILQPFDFVGETPLPPGFYTYELDISEAGEISLNFTAD